MCFMRALMLNRRFVYAFGVAAVRYVEISQYQYRREGIQKYSGAFFPERASYGLGLNFFSFLSNRV